MALLKSKSAANDAAYIAVPSFIIAPSVAQATNDLAATLNRTLATLTAEYQAKFNDRAALNSEYQSYDRTHSVTSQGIPYRSDETDLQKEMAKKKAVNDAKEVKAEAHNARVKERQDKLETEGNLIAAKMRRIKALIGVIGGAARGPLLYDAAALLVSRPPAEQLIALSVLTKGAAVSFGDAGEYVTKDIRLVTALMDTPSERLELIK